MNRYVKYICYSLLVLFIVLIILLLLLQLPAVQTYAVNKVNHSLSEKLDNKISVSSVDINFFNNVDLNGIYVEDQSQDTLAFIEELNVSASLIGLFKKELLIKQVELDGAYIHLKKDAETERFNYQFIIDAFASTDTLSEKSTEGSFNLNIDQVQVSDTHFILEDAAANSNMDLQLDEGYLEISTFDLASNKFELDELSLDKAVLKYDYTPDPNKQTSELAFPRLPFTLNLEEISLNESSLAIKAKNSTAKEGSLVYDNLSLTNLQLEGQNISLDSTQISGELSQLRAKDQSGFELTDFKSNFAVTNQNIEISDLELSTPNSKISNSTLLTFKDFADLKKVKKLKVTTSFDKNSIGVADINYFVDLSSQKIFDNISADEKVILDGDATGDIKYLKFSKLRVRIPGVIGMNIDGYLKDLTDMDRFSFDVTLNKARVISSKLSKLLPENTLPPELDAFGDITLDGAFKGDLTSFQIEQMNLGTSVKTSAQLSGTINNVRDPKKLLLDVNIKALNTHLDDIKGFIKGDLPPAIKDAGNIGYTGIFKGTLTDFAMDGNLSTDIGGAKTDIALNFNSDYSEASYNGGIILDDFNLGSILNNEDFGLVSLVIKTDGSGLDLENIDNQVNAQFSSLIYKGIEYQNFDFNGSIANKVINGDFNIDNQNAVAAFKGLLDLSDEEPEMNFLLDIDTLSLLAMNLSPQDIALSGKAEVKGKGNSIDDFIGILEIDGLNIRKDSLIYHTDSLLLSSTLIGTNNKELKLTTDGIESSVKGDFNLSQIPIYVEELIDEYIPIQWIVKEENTNDRSLQTKEIFTASLEIKNEDLLHLFIPKLHQLEDLSLYSYVNSEKESLLLNGSIRYLEYDKIKSKNIDLFSQNKNKTIENDILFEEMTGIANLMFPHNSIHAILQKDKLRVELDVKNDSMQNLIILGGDLTNNAGLYEFKFDEALELDSATWSISEEHSIQFKKNYLFVDALSVSKDLQVLRVQSDKGQPMGNTPLNVQLDNFDIHELSNLYALENDVIYGIANGKIILDSIFADINYSGDLLVNNIIVKEKEIGDLAIEASKRDSGQILDLNVSLIGDKNDFTGKGYLDLETKNLKFDSNFDKLELAVLDPFIVKIISESKGTFGGNISVEGSLEKPIINGTITTNELSTLVNFSQTRYEINNQTFQIDNSEISLDNLTLTDTNGKTAQVNGQITHNNFTDFNYDLSVESTGFQYLNTTVEDNPLFYGTLFLDLEGTVTGPLKLPNLDVDAKALAGSIFHLSPFIDSDVISEDDYIIFTNKDFVDLDSTEVSIYELKNSLPLNLTLDLEVDPETEFQFIIDPITEDRLSVFGNASLQVKIPPSGNIEVYGVYTVSTGKYNFSYEKLLKREFDLSQGGRVTFQGDPLLAQFNVNAVYNTKASPAPLIASTSLEGSAEVTAARQRTAVQILLNLSGSISDLILNFKLNFPEDDYNSATAVGRKIADIESDQQQLYNQVFSLLLLNSFFADSGSNLGNAAPNAALKSVSGLIEDRLNKLADNLIQGFEININLDSYASDNTSITELGVGVTKKLFDDRLTLQAIGNVNVDNSTNTAAASGIAGDFIIEYRLNEKGNYSVSAFRKSDFNILQAENSNKNGAGIQYRKSLRLRKLKKKAGEK